MSFFTPLTTWFATWDPPIPRKHLYAILALTGFTLASVAMLPAPDMSQGDHLRFEFPIGADNATNQGNTEYNDVIPDNEIFDPKVDGGDDGSNSEPHWIDYRVRSGDTLGEIFDSQGIPPTILHKLLELDKKKQLANLSVGQQLELQVDNSGILQQLKLRLSLKETLVFTRAADGAYQLDSELREVTWSNRTVSGSINGSFALSAKKAGLSSKQIQKIASLFQWRLNLAKELRKGDTFEVLLKQELVEGQKSGSAELIGVEFLLSGNKRVGAWLAEDGNYYDDKGEGLERGFRRFPTQSRYRLSSHFSPARRNPVTGRVRPHEGTDFAMPVGATVVSTGEGVVVKASRHPVAGNYVVIKHNRTMTTRYMHLSRLLVKPGQKVKMGQKLGLSGNTGRSTGPHLHYEVRINNRAVDPMKARLPMAKSLDRKEKRQFLADIERYRTEMKG